MKILHVIPSCKKELGGPIQGVLSIQKFLYDKGCTTEIVTFDKEYTLTDMESLSGKIKLHCMGPAFTSYAFSLNFRRWIKDNIEKFDVVIINGIWQYHSFFVSREATKKNIPYFVFTHGMLDPWFKRKYPLKHIKKWLYWPWGEYRVLRDARNVLFTCEEERLQARKSFWLYKVNEAVIPYGINIPKIENSKLKNSFFKNNPELIGKRLILFMGRIHEKKGCDILIKAFSHLVKENKNLHLIIAGPDKDNTSLKLKKLALKYYVDKNISWLGMVNGDDKWSALCAAEVFCLPSHQENFGIVVAEALACSTPVLISNKVNIYREIEKYQVGFVDEDSVDGTVNNFQRWLELDVDKFNAMKDRTQPCFYSQFHAENMVEELIKLIKK